MNLRKSIKFNFFLLFNFIFYYSFSQAPGFADEVVSDQFTIPTGLTFDKSGQLYVWEKAGKVFKVNKKTGDKTLLLDISEEVYDYLDHGLNGLALDPDFLSNGFIYVLYTVDHNYLFNKNLPTYDISQNDKLSATIARLTRYTLRNKTIDQQSRKVIIGEDFRNAIPILMDNHGIGSLVFGKDGSLMVSVGDGAVAKDPPFHSGDVNYSILVEQPIAEGIISADQNIGPYRSQYLNSLNGKILRINPETGEGYSGNPFFDSGNPDATRSRIWAYGLRNPFRFSFKPGSGESDPAKANPGLMFVGDVGWASREEINIIDKGGMNFGWPVYEGVGLQHALFNDPKYFPENAIKPAVEWRGQFAQSMINGEPYNIGSPQFKGDNFFGSASIGGLWLSTDHFPGYKNTYMHGDYEGWIRIFHFDIRNEAYKVDMVNENVHPTCFAEDPTDGSIYYTNYFYPSINELRHIFYDKNPNKPPVISAFIEPYFGVSPLQVFFNASDSKDPEGGSLKFEWSYGNQLGSPFSEDYFTYADTEEKVFYPYIKVTDLQGKSSTKQFRVFLNNFPPEIKSTSLDNVTSFKNEDGLVLPLSAEIVNHKVEELFYDWNISLHHEDHSHLITTFRTATATDKLAPIPCDGQRYSYEVSLTVSDKSGLSANKSFLIKPQCPENQVPLGITISPNPIENTLKLFAPDYLDMYSVKSQLFDIHGRLLFSTESLWNKTKTELNDFGNKLSAGQYLIRVITDKGAQTVRFVKN